FFFSSRRRHTRLVSDWSSDVCSSDLAIASTPPGGVVDFEPGLSGTITLAGELDIAKDLSITGPGACVVAVSGDHASRVFQIAARSEERRVGKEGRTRLTASR